MRLINTETLEIQEYFGDNIPKYAILSHTWGEGEVSYQDWQFISQRTPKKGYRKILASCKRARRRSINHLWVDTNCINKDSSAELAINSMFTWYQRSAICFVYLEDLDFGANGLAGLETCRYWGRGWTLQELLAPRNVQFYDFSWQSVGTKDSLLDEISNITSVPSEYLRKPYEIPTASIAQRMSWAAHRSTTRTEDMAYCLIGIFDVNMPLLYGEGDKAFIRLQEEIIKHNDDQTIFCWSQSPWTSRGYSRWLGCFAPHPITFCDSVYSRTYSSTGEDPVLSEFHLTNTGLRINLLTLRCLIGGDTLATLAAEDPSGGGCCLCICLEMDLRTRRFFRSGGRAEPMRLPRAWFTVTEDIYLSHYRHLPHLFGFPQVPLEPLKRRYAIIPVYSMPKGSTEVVVLAEFGQTEDNKIEDDMIVLDQTSHDPIDVWHAQLIIDTRSSFLHTAYELLNIDFKIHIPRQGSTPWETTTRTQGRTESESGHPSTMQSMSLPEDLELTFQRGDIQYQARPLLISLTEYLEEERKFFSVEERSKMKKEVL
ncbi:hypothetical protein LTR10_022537 [Elasticomyces elasticus]|uniref:Heterokaryon incompatibility domain-containing protein n=1 Tax=Exophiala sideris TaxID=1016849 RepID=A0ABR0JG23_9EURO|nr:hypothetical protein LTR10_022537 [Elasticomyces elasticus]KAK5024017.1 hypothetical protein LTR13_011035 [Exophiala sideris]KAK5025595.1 hypothetical protein LTS07_007799 [Exophiala sideris]KAK5063680.1 hypothetical protein LTR69_004386 [Exophiala sideris]KAK5176380.1 hypothetical protein LTR44_011064 [Eurotiomycetes sp. CCFEE 6388]